ncbi:hypothetical protein PanWU01x14_043750 [Parasponia andersonii]|uniref:Uncharacterized protein n=1 Tax=Parasponia andersonii TaxID=3476 RepID=A0A2P5DQ47_PARAD|nr:hypothetical protein PanWU01x14_043750 [Parasponia andersonii]
MTGNHKKTDYTLGAKVVGNHKKRITFSLPAILLLKLTKTLTNLLISPRRGART